MKALEVVEYCEILKMIFDKYGFYSSFNDENKNKKFIKYIDCTYDSRFNNIYKVTMRSFGREYIFDCYYSVDDEKIRFDSMYEWIVDFFN